jgi:putative ABC transport system ATP-binding protein
LSADHTDWKTVDGERIRIMKNHFDFENVSFSWPGGRSILKEQSFAIPVGVFTVVRGMSGTGKSTLLRLMNRLEEPQSGVIRYLGRPLSDYEPPRLRKQVAYLQQMPVMPNVTVRETLLSPFAFVANKETVPPTDKELSMRLDELLLGNVGLDDRATALSVGQRQRLCLVRALMSGPDTLLLDEPTASLDNESSKVVERRVEKLCNKGTTVVMVTHDNYMPSDVHVLEIRLRNGKVEL